MKKAAALVVLALVLVTFPALGQQRDKLDENTVFSVLKSVERDLTRDDVDVRMIKRLSDRVKVNLDYKGSNAVLYLKWKKVRNLYRWWFERDFEQSLVVFSSSYSSVRRDAQLVDEESAARAPVEKKAEPEETAEAEEEPEDPQPEPKTERKAEVKEKPAATEEAETKETTESQPRPAQTFAEKIEKKIAEKEAEEKKSVVKTEVKVEQKVEKEAEQKELQETTEPAPEVKKEVEVKKEAEVAAEVETAKEIKPQEAAAPVETAKPEKPKPEEAKPEPEVEKKPTIVNRDRRLADTPETATPEPEPVEEETVETLPMEEAAAETEAEAEASKPFVTPSIATGPEGTAQQFIATMLVTLGKGEIDDYHLYLLREDEMTSTIEEEDFQRGKSLWIGQMQDIHKKLKGAKRVEIQRVILQTPQTSAIEQNTIDSLERRVVKVNKVYTYVRISLKVDGEAAYLTIGGLMKTPGGWRIGGRMEYLDSIALQ
jgi:chemotaxis protein histidine kinase CheA